MFTSENIGINRSGHLTLGGADVPALADKYRTPLYLMDEDAIRAACRAWRDAMRKYLGYDSRVAYAGKAFCISEMYRILEEEEMYADIVSGGELYTALHAGFPAEKLYFHGNNKTADEINAALDAGVGRFVVDSEEELVQLDGLARRKGKIPSILLRLKPGIDAHTHDYILTGKIDSKFGVAIENGEAFDLVRQTLKRDNIRLEGVHCHIGSQIFEREPFERAAACLVDFVALIRDRLGYEMKEINLGGGYGIRYLKTNDPLTAEQMISAIAGAIKKTAAAHQMAIPRVVIEPGRSIVGPAGITVYTVGSVKEIPGIRTYVSVDGGMTDNPRFALYEAPYEIVNPRHPLDEKSMCCTLAGRNCESGDLIGRDMPVQPLKAGDYVAVFATGAYNYSMASNYNRVPRPPVVMIRNGEDRLVVRRETYADLVACDVLEVRKPG